MIKKRVLFAIMMAYGASRANAGAVYTFEGVVDGIFGNSAGVFAGTQLDDTFTLSFEVDPDAISVSQGSIGLKRDVTQGTAMLVIGDMSTTFNVGSVTVGDDDPIDFFNGRFSSSFSSGVEESFSFASSFGISEPPPIDGTGLPTQAEIDGLNFLNIFYGRNATSASDDFDIEFRVDSVTVVPAPAPAALLGTCGALVMRRRR